MNGDEKPVLTWRIKRFDDLSLMELHDLLRVRLDIFVVEQGCPYSEIDGKDPECIHVLGTTSDNELIATARIVPAGVIYDEWSIGRVVVKKEYRKFKIGKELMEISIDHCIKEHEAKTIKIAAQEYLKGFYEDLKFEQISGRYMWDGIEHIDMRLYVN